MSLGSQREGAEGGCMFTQDSCLALSHHADYFQFKGEQDLRRYPPNPP